jgi:hypothetical protein
MVNDRARLTGRNLEPWRAILAVALWLDDKGAGAVFQRIEALSVAYQIERTDLESGDLSAIVIRALCRYAENAMDAVNIGTIKIGFTFKTAAITQTAQEVVGEIEADIDPAYITSRRIGRILAKMRLKPDRTAKAKGWHMSIDELRRCVLAYGLSMPERLEEQRGAPDGANGSDGTDGTTARAADHAGDVETEVFEL